MRTVQVQLFSSWSDTYGNKREVTRPGIIIHIEGKTKLIPIMSGNPKALEETNSVFPIPAKKYGIATDSWLAFGYEVDYNRSMRKKILRKAVEVDMDTLMTKRSNYHNNPTKVSGSPY